jgi:hypothetical protein
MYRRGILITLLNKENFLHFKAYRLFAVSPGFISINSNAVLTFAFMFFVWISEGTTTFPYKTLRDWFL